MREDAAGADGAQFGGLASGLSTIAVAALGYAALSGVAADGPVGSGAAAAALALAAVGLAQVLAPRLRPRLGRLGPRWTGVLWAVVGVGVAAVAVAASPGIGRLGTGLVLGAGLALYGCAVALRG
jgi:hypothetical protein